jgi:NAD(P)-dependent dehydrogenase (short-subunit alcohol dehydrogenase family)
LVTKGYRVFGTARNEKDTDSIAAASEGRATLTICDVTSDADVASLHAFTVASLQGRGIDLLFSNVGTLTPGPLEMLSIDAVRHEFEVDVFGALRVVRAFLPQLRLSRGRIVQVSSWSAKLPLPFSGPSSACKAALEAFADAYRGELGPSGVEFITVLPGNMRTDAPAKSAAAINRVLERMTEEERGLYGHRFQAFQRAFNQAQDSGMRADEAVDLIIAAAEQTPSPIRTAIGAEAASVLRLVREHSDIELDDVRLQFLGLKPGRPF